MTGLLAVAAAITSACGPRAQTPSSAGQTLVVLLPDAGGASSGRASVSNQRGGVDLVEAREATSAMPAQVPAPPAVIPEAEVQRIFGEALAAVPQEPEHFVLRFEFNSDELTPDSRALLPKVLQALANRPAPDLMVIGHTDTTGSAASNQELGLRRAESVRRLLLAAGFDDAYIEVTSHGEATPDVATGDDVSEPRNRRVELTVR